MLDLYVPAEAARGTATYRALAEHLKTLIFDGRLPPGTKLPSVRALAKRLGVSNLTVQRAYSELAEGGFTHAATNRGTWVALVQTRDVTMQVLTNIQERGALNMFDRITSEGGIRSMALSLPDPALFDPNELLADFAELRQASKWAWTHAPENGVPELLHQVIKLLGAQGLSCTGDQLMITMGARHGLALAVSVLQGKVLVEDPAPLHVAEALCVQGVTSIPYRRDYDGIDLNEIERLAATHRPAALVITTVFHNPTGGNLPTEQRSQLIQLAREFGFKIVELDPLRSISFDENPPVPLAADSGEDVIYIGSLSYCLAPGLRTGFVRCTPDVRDKMADHMRLTVVCPPAFLQLGLANFMAKGGLHRHLARTVPKYRARRDALETAIRLHMPECSATHALGGFTCWVTLPEGDFRELAQQTLDRGVAILRGSAISKRPDADRHIRLAFATLQPDSIWECVRTIADVVDGLTSARQRGETA